MMVPDFENPEWKAERKKRWAEWVLPFLKKHFRRKELKYLERIYWGEPFDRETPDFEAIREKHGRYVHIDLLLLSPHQNVDVWMRDLRLEPDGRRLRDDLDFLLGIKIDHRRYGWDTETAVEWTNLLVTEQLNKECYAPFGFKESSPFSRFLVFLDQYLMPVNAWFFGVECQGELINDGNKWSRLNHLLKRLFDLSTDLLFVLGISGTNFSNDNDKVIHVWIRRVIQRLLYLSFDYEGRYDKVRVEGSLDLEALGDLTERKIFLAEFAGLLANDPRAAALYEATSKDDYVVTG